MTTVPTVAVFVTDDAIYVISEKMTEVARVTTEPMRRLERNSPPDVVGHAVLEGLEAFRDTDDPPDPGGQQRFLDFVGATAWKPFARSAVNFSIAGLSTDTVALSPARANSRGDYLYRDTHECPRSPAAIGEMIEALVKQLTG
jgi:hypothetical protein